MSGDLHHAVHDEHCDRQQEAKVESPEIGSEGAPVVRKGESSLQQEHDEGEHEAQRQAMGVHHLELGPGGEVVGLVNSRENTPPSRPMTSQVVAQIASFVNGVMVS